MFLSVRIQYVVLYIVLINSQRHVLSRSYYKTLLLLVCWDVRVLRCWDWYFSLCSCKNDLTATTCGTSMSVYIWFTDFVYSWLYVVGYHHWGWKMNRVLLNFTFHTKHQQSQTQASQRFPSPTLLFWHLSQTRPSAVKFQKQPVFKVLRILSHWKFRTWAHRWSWKLQALYDARIFIWQPWVVSLSPHSSRNSQLMRKIP